MMVVRTDFHRLSLQERCAIAALIEAKLLLLSDWCSSGRSWKCLGERRRLMRRVQEQASSLRDLCRQRSHPTRRRPVGRRIFNDVYALLRSLILLIVVDAFTRRLWKTEAVAQIAPTR